MRKNKTVDEEFEQFKKEVIDFLSTHPEHEEFFYNKIRNEQKMKSALWGAELFEAWKKGKMEWFINNSILQYEAERPI